MVYNNCFGLATSVTLTACNNPPNTVGMDYEPATGYYCDNPCVNPAPVALTLSNPTYGSFSLAAVGAGACNNVGGTWSSVSTVASCTNPALPLTITFTYSYGRLNINVKNVGFGINCSSSLTSSGSCHPSKVDIFTIPGADPCAVFFCTGATFTVTS